MPKGLKGFQKGGAPFKGKKHSEAAKEKIRLANSGDKSPAKRPEVREKMRIAHLGKKLPKEQIEKMVASRAGYRHSEATKEKQRLSKLGNRNPHFGRRLSDEHRAKISSSLRTLKSPPGSDIYRQVISSIRRSGRAKEWKHAVYKRDNYKCVWCGYDKGKILQADHIKPFVVILKQFNILTVEDAFKCTELWDINNGRTLCEPCHKLTDSWGSKAKKLLWQ